MVAVDEEREIVRHPSADDVGVLPAAGIFGPNASGKTNVLRGLNWLSTAVQESLRRWDDEIPVDPFVLLESPEPVSSFTVDLLLKGMRFEYLLDVTSEQVEYEALFYYPENNRQRLILAREHWLCSATQTLESPMPRYPGKIEKSGAQESH